jgi:hypothetical protein
MINCLDWDNKNDFNEGVTAFQITLEATDAVAEGNFYMMFDASGLNYDVASSVTKRSETIQVASESSVSLAALKNITFAKSIYVKRIVYEVLNGGTTIDPFGSVVPATKEMQLSNDLVFQRAAIDGGIKKNGDLSPNFERRNYMYQPELITIPVEMEINDLFAFSPFMNLNSKCRFIFEVEKIV